MIPADGNDAAKNIYEKARLVIEKIVKDKCEKSITIPMI